MVSPGVWAGLTPNHTLSRCGVGCLLRRQQDGRPGHRLRLEPTGAVAPPRGRLESKKKNPLITVTERMKGFRIQSKG